MKRVNQFKWKCVAIMILLMSHSMSFAQDYKSLIVRRAEAFIKSNIQKGKNMEDTNYLKNLPLRTDLSCETEFGFLVAHEFSHNVNETVTTQKYIWIFSWSDFMQVVRKKIEECPIRKEDPFTLCRLLGVPEGSKTIYVAKISLKCDGDITRLLFRPAYQTDITSRVQIEANHKYKWNIAGLNGPDIKYIKENIINENKSHYPITTCFGYTLDLDYFNTINYYQQEEINDGTRRAKDYVGVPEYILKPDSKYTIRQIYTPEQIFNETKKYK